MPAMVSVTDPQGRVLLANQAHRSFFSLTGRQGLGDSLAALHGEAMDRDASLIDPDLQQQIRAGRDQQMAEMEKMQKADASLSLADKAASAGQKFAGASQALPLLQQLAQQGGLLPEGLAGLLGQAAGAAQGGAGGGGQGEDPAAAWPEPESSTSRRRNSSWTGPFVSSSPFAISP